MPVIPLTVATTLAAAIAAPLMIDVEIRARGTAERGGTVVVTGLVTCSDDTVISLEGEVVEFVGHSDVASGTFATDVLCQGGPTAWTAIVDSTSGIRFKPGFASAEVRAVAFDSESGVFSGVQTLARLHLTRSNR